MVLRKTGKRRNVKRATIHPNRDAWSRFQDAVEYDLDEHAIFIYTDQGLNLRDWYPLPLYRYHPVYHAIHNKNTFLVRFMVQNGLEVNNCSSLSEKGRNPLQEAIYSDNHYMVEMLLQNGADPFILYKGRTALEIVNKLKYKGGNDWINFGDIDDLYYHNMDLIYILIKKYQEEDIKEPEHM